MDQRDYARVDARLRSRYYTVEEDHIVPNLDYLDDDEGLVGPFPVQLGRPQLCPVCDGYGKHVNPSIDRHGLSRADFDEDPDFEQDYFSGAYDVECSRCQGKRVVQELEPTTPEGVAFLKRVEELVEDAWRGERESAAERRYMYGSEYEW
jgi:hypothetical protein